jgi:transposase-like protein
MANNVKRYSMRFRQRVVERMQLEKNISQLSRELGLDRSMMYIWKRKLEKRAYGNVRSGEVNPRDRQVQELQAKIQGLEGVIGRQALELDFFESALRRIRDTAPSSGGDGENTSTPKSAVEPQRKAD